MAVAATVVAEAECIKEFFWTLNTEDMDINKEQNC